jgi:hypothetical protein
MGGDQGAERDEARVDGSGEGTQMEDTSALSMICRRMTDPCGRAVMFVPGGWAGFAYDWCSLEGSELVRRGQGIDLAVGDLQHERLHRAGPGNVGAVEVHDRTVPCL